jgi:hypothetical protein
LKQQKNDELPAPANFTLKLVRPGFGPPAEPAAVCQRDGVTPVAVRHSVL